MTRLELVDHLAMQFARVQKSERWAMYRLIAPVVDHANASMGLRVYFEFNQTSLHGTSQSVDIALLDNSGLPRVMIEAKRLDRAIAAEQIAKYLPADTRGIVTNGLHWVLCLNGRDKLVTLCDAKSREMRPHALDEIVAFIRGESLLPQEWRSQQDDYVASFIRPERLTKTASAQRAVHDVTVVRDIRGFRAELDRLPGISPLDRVLLTAMTQAFEELGQISSTLRIEFRKTRVSIFGECLDGRRIARLELGKRQPDVLILTELVQGDEILCGLSQPAPHDKGPHMRRFRLSHDIQAASFGRAMAALLNVCDKPNENRAVMSA